MARACIKIISDLPDYVVGQYTDLIEEFEEQGLNPNQAGILAAQQMIENAQAESASVLEALREQHPEAYLEYIGEQVEEEVVVEPPRRKLKAAAYKIGSDVYTGLTHAAAMAKASAAMGRDITKATRKELGGRPIKGYVTNEDVFVDETAAAIIALEAGQIRDNAAIRGVTEDLKAGRKTSVPSETVIGLTDAVQEREAAPVDAAKPTGRGEQDGTGDATVPAAPREGSKAGTKKETLKRKGQRANKGTSGKAKGAEKLRKKKPARSEEPEPVDKQKQQPPVAEQFTKPDTAWEAFRQQLREEGEVPPVSYDRLTGSKAMVDAKRAWDAMFRDGKYPDIDDFENLIEPLETTPRQSLDDAVFTLGENPSVSQYRDAVDTIVRIAVAEGGDQSIKNEARDFLLSNSDEIIEPWQQQLIGDVIAEEIREKAKTSKRGVQLQIGPKDDKKETTRLQLMRAYGLMDFLAGEVAFRDIPADFGDAIVAAAEADTERMTGATKATKGVVELIEKVLDKQTRRVLERIPAEDFNAFLGGVLKNKVFEKELKRALSAEGIDFDYLVRGEPLRSWLNESRTNLNWQQEGSSVRLVAQDRTTMSFEELMSEMDSDPRNGRNRRISDDTEITAPLSMGRIKMLVQKARKAFKGAKPQIYVFKNVDELKRKNPKLYEEAAARRPQGDFDNTRAAGYSYDNKVFIFADNVSDKQELAFTLAHEVLGHMGMRAVFAPAEFKRLMDKVYNASYEVRAAADGYMDTYGTDKYEAIEEAIAEYAAWLDNSVLGMFRKAFRGFMNRLGFKFDDDMLRYMVAQSRRYVRTGKGATTTSPSEVAAGVLSQAEVFQEGRFRMASNDFMDIGFASRGTHQRAQEGTGLAGTVAGFRDYMKESGMKDAGRMIGKGVEKFQSMSNASGRSFGLRKVFGVFQDQTHYVRSIQARMAQRTQFTTDRSLFGGGPTEKQKKAAGQMLTAWALYMNDQLTEQQLRDSKPFIVFDAEGKPEIDYDAVREAQEYAGLSFTQDPATGEWRVGDKDVRKMFEDGIRFTYIDENDKEATHVMDIPDLDDATWAIFLENRDAVNFGAVEQLHAKMMGFWDYRQNELGNLARLKSIDGQTMDEQDVAFMRRVAQQYQEMYDRDAKLEGEALKRDPARMEEANAWLGHVTKAIRKDGSIKMREWEDALAGREVKEGEITQSVIDNPQDYRWVVDGLKRMRNKEWTTNQSLRMNEALSGMHMIQTQATNADLYARRTIMGAYVPFMRKGKYQVKIVALDEQGDVIKLGDELAANLPYFKVNSGKARDTIITDLKTNVLGLEEGQNEKQVTATYTDEDGKKTKKTYTLAVRWAEAPDIKPLHETINYDEFVQTLTRLNIGLDPKERERAVEALTRSHSTARKNLMRTATPGWEPDVVGATAEHLETVSHITGKNRYRHRLRQIMDNNSFWNGSDSRAKARLKGLQDAYRIAKASENEAAEITAHRALAEYQRMMIHMTEGEDTVTILNRDLSTEKVAGKAQFNEHRKMATDLVDFYDNALNIQGDPVSGALGETAGAFMSLTAAMQLGMSVATAAINMGSLGTHAIPYLQSYNEKLGYGGGFGFGAATAAITKASKDMALTKDARRLADPVFLTELRNNDGYKKYNLNLAEYEMLLELSREGVLQANMFNAMIGAARGTKQVMGPFLDKWMTPFTMTEQLNRRATALATYRLEKQRMEAQGIKFGADAKTDAEKALAEKAEKQLLHLATNAVNYSQGEYAQYNRPALARHDLTQFLFMYKQFVVITIENLRNMGWTGTAASLAMIGVLSGMKGLPFGEDLMDLVDTLAQKFGIKMGPVEVELSRAINYMIPGAAPWVMNGLADRLLDTMVSSRISMGDLLPLTGALKAGADPIRELGNFFGPVYSSVSGLAAMASGLAKYGAEVVGLREDTSDLRDILRDTPIAGLRAAMDGLSYAVDGKITNSRGQVVSNDVNVWNMITRMMGFYPRAAAEQYDIIRLAKQTDAYAMELKMNFTEAFIRAKTRGDHKAAREIQGLVRDWNREAKGTPFYIRNFTASANRAAREANRTAIDRYFKTAPKPGRQSTEQIIRMYGLNDLSELAN